MGPNIKKNTIYAKVLDRKIVMVDISIHPECLPASRPLKENKANSYKWFTEEHFDRLMLKLQDVILAKVLAPSETGDKKKSGKGSHRDCSEMLPDPELFIQYQFVKKRRYKQTVLIREKEESVSENQEKVSRQSEYSGGGHRSYDFFPEKLNVTVSLTSQNSQQVMQDVEEQRSSKSTISKYFSKDTAAAVTHSTHKKRAALKNMNKNNDPKKKIKSLVYTTSSVGDESAVNENKNQKATGSVELEGETQCKLDQVSWVNQLGQEVEIQDVLGSQEDRSSKVGKQEEHGNDILLTHGDKSEQLPYDSSENCSSIVSAMSPKNEDYLTATSCNEDVESVKHTECCDTVSDNKDLDSKFTTKAAKLKRRRSHSESDSTDIESVPSLRSRLSKKNILKKLKTMSSDESGPSRKETDSSSVKIGEDNDFETPKTRRNTGKRKGSDLSDDQDLYSSCFSTNDQTVSSSNHDVKEGLKSKKRQTKKAADVNVEVSERKGKTTTKKRIRKRQVKATSKTTPDGLEDVSEEPGSSPLEPITIEDKPPMTLDVSAIEDLSENQTEQLVWECASELREIFEGKKYCRRHEDYKRGGKVKGDLAFQVQFGQFSEEQRDKIIGVLTDMFCYKHSKYFDYVSKVLLPETLVMIYMKVVGKTREEAELLLLEGTTSAN